MENKEYEKIKFTGERMLNHPESLLYQVSMERYKFAAKFSENKAVLDIACGSGHGSDFLAKKARSVLGVDIDSPTIAYCQQNYSRRNLEFLKITADEKKNDFINKFDLIVSFETIEHVRNYSNFLENLKSYLNNSGKLILSTPNNFKKISPPENKFHIQEFDILEMHEILKKIFPARRIHIFGQIATNQKRWNQKKSKKDNLGKRAIQYSFRKIYQADRKYLGLLPRFEHCKAYKFISRFQRDPNFSFHIHKINHQENFSNPEVALFLVENK